MNRNSINAATINATPATGGQRVIVSSSAYARASITGRAGGRSPLASKPKAISAISMRAWARAIMASSGRAVSTVTGLFRVKSKVGVSARAQAAIAGNIAPRGYTNQPVLVSASAIVWLAGRIHARAPGTYAPEARITLASPKSYSRFHVAINATGRAYVQVSPEQRKQIPYDADAPEERTIFIPGVNRLMVV